MRSSFYQTWGKRAFDLAIAVPCALLLLPLIVLVAVVAWAMMGRPVLYRQQRAGRGGRTFTLLKFRSMTDATDGHGNQLSDRERLTAWGRFLRRYSLDELPQLWNVIRGDMSLVGPRPLVARYLPRYSTTQARRHEVRPGITGWAQIHGRNLLSWEEKFDLDVWYVDHVSWIRDCSILLRTAGAMLSPHGVSAECCDTMPEFQGLNGKQTAPQGQTNTNVG